MPDDSSQAIARLGVVLRAPRMDDLEAVLTIHGDPRTNQDNPSGPLEDAAEATQMLAGWIEDWRTRGIGYWAIEDSDSRRVVGFAGVRAMRAGQVEVLNLYYRLSSEVWGRGIAGAVAREAIARAHRDWPGVAVIARMQPGHAASERTAVSAGLREVGRDPWGRIVLADRDLSGELLASLPGTEAAAPSSGSRLEVPAHDIVGIRAANPGPFTLRGTNSWIVGRAPAWLIDPGPALDEHVAALQAEIDLRGGLGGVALTHDHADHTEAVPAIRARYPDAPLAAAAQADVDVELADGDPFGPLHAIATPGHAPEHLAFVTGTVALTGDAVLGEGSVFVSPYPGSLAAYLDGLARLKQRELTVLCPGHGPIVNNPQAKLEQYITHRLDRERRLLAALGAGKRRVDELLDEAWSDAPAQLRPAATVTLAAHLDKLADEGRLPDGVERPTLRF